MNNFLKSKYLFAILLLLQLTNAFADANHNVKSKTKDIGEVKVQVIDDKKILISFYLEIQESLASDNLIMAQAAATKISAPVAGTDSEMTRIKSSSDVFRKTKNLDDARNEFKKLSTLFIKWVKEKPSAGLIIAYCPMAGAKWLQKDGAIANPYYGKEMLTCGEKIK